MQLSGLLLEYIMVIFRVAEDEEQRKENKVDIFSISNVFTINVPLS